MPIPTTNSVSSLVQSLGEFPPEAVVFGHSEAMQALRSRMDKVASANVPVLIQGESGTGKDIIARMIHGLSPVEKRAVRQGELPRHSGNAAGKRTVRIRKGRLHRSLRHQAGTRGNGPSRHAFSGRDFRTRSGAAVEAVAVAAGRAILPHRRPGRQESGSPHRLRHQPSTGSGNRKRDIPAGSVLPHQRGELAHAALARTPRGY